MTAEVASSGPNRIEELQKTISASRLNTWLQCRLKFYFRYVQRITKPPTPALHVGSVIHLVLQNWNMARWKKQPWEPSRAQGVFDAAWQKQPVGIHWDEKETDTREGAWSLLRMYLEQTPIPPNEVPEAVEVPIDADLTKHGLPMLIGVLDLVRAGGRIVDFKTSGKTPSPENALHMNEVQLSCYSVLYREAAGRTESGLELHHLVKTKAPKLVVTCIGPMSQGQQTKLFRLMESYVEGLSRKDFVPSPGLQCLGCEYINECRMWV